MKTFAEHLQELKIRAAICMAVVGVGSLVGFLIHKPVEQILQRPLNQTLYYSNPAGGLSFVMQIALGVGVLLALPVLLYQIIQFTRPAVKPVSTRNIIILIICSLILSVCGVAYAYFISLPAALHFLVTFNSDNVKALISVSDYVKFLFAYILGTVVAFQLPLALFFANKIRRFPPGAILNMQRPAIVGAIIFAGVVTPTVDPINQMLVALPVIALFQIGAFAVWVHNRVNKPLPRFEIKVAQNPVQIVVPLEEATPVVAAGLATSQIVDQQVAKTPVAVPVRVATEEDSPKPVRPVMTPRRMGVDVFVPAH